MISLQLDKNNNLVVSGGNLSTISGITACAQDTRTRVGLCAGENPYDTTEGIDYFSEMLGKLGGLDYIRERLRARILDNPEITGIRKLDIKSADGQTVVAADITCIYGDFGL